MSFRRLPPLTYGLVALAATAIVYLPVTWVYFWADDFVWMRRFRDEPPLHVLVSVFGGHLLFVRNLVFYASWLLFGFRPEPYHWIAYGTHLANVALLFVVLRRTTGSARLAGLGALMWGTSPLCAGTLGWYSVYGHALVATILLIVLCQVAHPRVPSLTDGVRWSGLLLAGALCFGVGLGLGLAFPAALFLLRPEVWRDRRLRVLFLSLPVVVVALYFGYRRIAGWLTPPPPGQSFLLVESTASPAAVLAMVWHLFAVGTAGLVLGLFSAPLAYPGGAARATLVVACALTALALITGDAHARRQLLAALVLAVGAYGMIALGRASYYAALGLPPQEAARQLRYHYAALIPLTVAICVVMQQLLRWRPLRRFEVLIVPLWLAGATVGFLGSSWHIDRAEQARSYVEVMRRNFATVIAAAPPGETISIPNLPVPRTVTGPGLGVADFPGAAALFAVLYPGNVVAGHRILFVEPSVEVLKIVRAGSDRRLAELVTPASGRRDGVP